MTEHELDAHIIARTLCNADVDGRLERWLAPEIPDEVRAVAEVEGWILFADPIRLPQQTPAESGKRAFAKSERRRLSPSAFLSSSLRLTLAMYPPFTGTPRVHASNRRGDSTFAISTAQVIEGDLPPIGRDSSFSGSNASANSSWTTGIAVVPNFRSTRSRRWSKEEAGHPRALPQEGGWIHCAQT